MREFRTIRLKTETAILLQRLGRKGETYDQIIRRLAEADLIERVQERIDTAKEENFVPDKRIPWKKIFEVADSDEKLEKILEAL